MDRVGLFMKLLFISDVHANIEALNAIIENVKYDDVYCLGDLVDYGPNPLECIDWIRGNNVPTVRGNHDNAVALHVDCGCGYAYKHLSEATREYTWASIGKGEESFLRGLPMTLELEADGLKLMLTHGSPASFFDYIDAGTPREKLEEYVTGLNDHYLIVGHTHKPEILKASEVTILNPGSVGQPRDKGPRASCMVFDTEMETCDIVRHEYEIDATGKKIRSSMPHARELEAILRRGY
jgi:putative phosphoesterase